jgi:hypothetical protein
VLKKDSRAFITLLFRGFLPYSVKLFEKDLLLFFKKFGYLFTRFTVSFVFGVVFKGTVSIETLIKHVGHVWSDDFKRATLQQRSKSNFVDLQTSFVHFSLFFIHWRTESEIFFVQFELIKLPTGCSQEIQIS